MSSLRNSPHKRSFQQFNSSQSSAWKSLRVQLVPPPVLEETCGVHVKKYITKGQRWEERPGSWMVEKLRNLAPYPFYSFIWLPCRKERLWIERDFVNNNLLDLSFCNWSVLPLYRQDKIAKMLSRGAFFAWRAPILSWPRIMCSQVRMLKFLEPPREMP